MADAVQQTTTPAPYVHPFNEGYSARCDGLTEYDNPYTEQGRDRAAWQHGWDEADINIAEDERADAE